MAEEAQPSPQAEDAPEEERTRPTLGGRVEDLGASVSEFVRWCGGLARLVARTLAVGPRRPIGLWDISVQVLQLGIRSLPLASLMSVFVGMILAWQFGGALADFGATQALGSPTALALVRELIPMFLAVTVGSKMATGMAAELGSMKVTEQIDAIAALGADPVKKLVWPRVVAATLALPLLGAWGNVLALLGGMFIADAVFDVSGPYFYTTYIDQLDVWDYSTGLTKTITFGFLAGVVGCYQGFQTKFGTEAVGISTTDTVVALSVIVLLADFALTAIFIPI